MMNETLITKCRVCPMEVVFMPGADTVKCKFCDTLNARPKKSDPEYLRTKEYADERRNMGEFAQAEAAYREILRQCTNEYTARWGLLLCKYGVIYMEASDSRKRMITCRRARNTLFCAEDDYQMVLKHAPADMRKAYEAEGKYIDDVQRMIRNLRPNAKAYDVFLCYKETAFEGGKTEDSFIVQAIYQRLTQKGYKVFYAPVSLKEKAGANYEAVVFLAIENSRVMLVIGTQKDYFNSAYVRSEWRRFKERMDIGDGEEKLLVPLFRRQDDLPDEIKPYQGYNMSLPYMEDIYSLLPSAQKGRGEEIQQDQEKEVESKKGKKVLALSRIFIKRGEFQKADEKLEALLEDEPENPEIWLLKAMIGMKIHEEVDFCRAEQSLTENADFMTALDCASGELKDRLEKYVDTAEKNLQEAKKKKIALAWKHINNGEFQKADDELKTVLEKQKDNAVIWLMKAMISMGIRKEEGLCYAETPLAENEYFQKAMDCASGELKERLESYVKIVERNIQEVGEAKYQFRIKKDGSAEITGYSGNKKEIIIPHKSTERNVTSIGDKAFLQHQKLVDVTIPDTVTSIGFQSFAMCRKLVNVTIPSSVTIIEDYAFEQCSKLRTVTIPPSVTAIRHGAFNGCTSLTIYGAKNSAAEIYARENHIHFVAL